MHRFKIVALLAVATVVFTVAGGGAASASHGTSVVDPGAFLTGPNSGEPREIGLRYLVEHAEEDLGLVAEDLDGLAVTDTYRDAHNGVTHVYVAQRYKGIPVFNGVASVNVAKDGSVINVGNRLVPNLAASIATDTPVRTAAQAVLDAALHLGLGLTVAPPVLEAKGGPTQETVFDGGTLSLQPIPVKLVFQPVGDAVRLAWNVEIYERSTQHWWSANVDAVTGDLLLKDDLVDDASYNVFASPKDSPSDGPRTIEVDPHDTLASPHGWHDTNNVPGADSTLTQGNNARAYTDTNADNVADPGSLPDGGAALVFDFPLDLTQQPSEYRPAAVVNLYYWNNVIHDVSYRYGFTEAAGNFQVNNYGRGGAGNDRVNAEAQDGSGLNNANFATPADGSSPRMQMFEWTSPAQVTVHGPAAVVGDYEAGSAAFGQTLTESGVRGEIEVAHDNVGNSTDGCEPIVGFTRGRIALVDRGTCTFVSKAKNAQEAGAIALVIANNIDGPPPGMSGADPTVTIPTVSVTNVAGARFKEHQPVDATLKAVSDLRRDSDFDNGVIAHEYGHGISNRLTGGPSNVFCLNTTVDAEQMGEGWSDWIALVLTAKAGETATQPRGIGTYVSFQPGNGPGIRPTPYTTDMKVNPSTYDTIKQPTITAPHGVGYVWATMLWEVYWNLVAKHGFNPDVGGAWTTGGNNLAFQLVMDGMKLQPCLPGFVDGRNAILQADRALTDGANQCLIWKGFAKRGLGYSASQGLFTLRDDPLQREAFDLPAECAANLEVTPTSVSSSVSHGAKDTKTLTLRNTGAAGSLPVEWTVYEARASCSTPGDLAWAAVTPGSGSTDGGASSTVSVQLDSTAVSPGQHRGLLCVKSDDPDTPLVAVPLAFDVAYVFTGFFGSVQNAPTLNAVKAGSGVNVIFSLAGNWGLNVFASGHPQSQQIDCASKAPQGTAVSTSPRRTLTYDATTDRYKYAWETSAAWDGTCRQFLLKLNDGTPARVAYFSFTK